MYQWCHAIKFLDNISELCNIFLINGSSNILSPEKNVFAHRHSIVTPKKKGARETGMDVVGGVHKRVEKHTNGYLHMRVCVYSLQTIITGCEQKIN